MHDTRYSVLSEQHLNSFSKQKVVNSVNFGNLESLQDDWNRRHERANRTAREQPPQLTSPRSLEVCKIYSKENIDELLNKKSLRMYLNDMLGHEERVSEVLRTSTHMHELNFDKTTHLLERKVNEEDTFTTNALKTFHNQGLWIGTKAEKLAAYIKFNEQEARRVPLLCTLREKWLELVDKGNTSKCVNTLGIEIESEYNVDDGKAESRKISREFNDGNNITSNELEVHNERQKSCNLQKEDVFVTNTEKHNSEHHKGKNQDLHDEHSAEIIQERRSNIDTFKLNMEIAKTYQIGNESKKLSAFNQAHGCKLLHTKANKTDYKDRNNYTSDEYNNKEEILAVEREKHVDVCVGAYFAKDTHKYVDESTDVNTQEDLNSAFDDNVKEENSAKEISTDVRICSVLIPLTINVNDDSCSLRDEHETTNIYYDPAADEITESETCQISFSEAQSSIAEGKSVLPTYEESVANKIEATAKHYQLLDAASNNLSNDKQENNCFECTLTGERKGDKRLSIVTNKASIMEQFETDDSVLTNKKVTIDIVTPSCTSIDGTAEEEVSIISDNVQFGDKILSKHKVNRERDMTVAEPPNIPWLPTSATTNAKAISTIPFISIADDVNGYFYYCANATWMDHCNTNETPEKQYDEDTPTTECDHAEKR